MPGRTLPEGEKSDPERGGYNPDPLKPSEEHPRRKPAKVDPKESPYEPDDTDEKSQVEERHEHPGAFEDEGQAETDGRRGGSRGGSAPT
jgi:hypothetical protein